MFVVYGTQQCPWCDRAKSLLDDKSVSYVYIDLAEDVDAQKMFKEKCLRTVPQVFYGDTLIGGYDNLKNYLDKPTDDSIPLT